MTSAYSLSIFKWSERNSINLLAFPISHLYDSISHKLIKRITWACVY